MAYFSMLKLNKKQWWKWTKLENTRGYMTRYDEKLELKLSLVFVLRVQLFSSHEPYILLNKEKIESTVTSLTFFSTFYTQERSKASILPFLTCERKEEEQSDLNQVKSQGKSKSTNYFLSLSCTLFTQLYFILSELTGREKEVAWHDGMHTWLQWRWYYFLLYLR